MKQLLLSALFLFTWNSFSQVGIGTTTPNASSSLDISSNTSGVLIPRVSLVDISNGTTPISSPATSLLVYNTNAAVTGGNGVGYYYWDGSKWTKLFDDNTPQHWSRSGLGKLYPTTLSDFVGIGTNNPQTNLHLISSSSNPVIFDGGNFLYLTFAENGVNRGYFGSFAGNPEDIEFGTYSGNLGALHLTTNNSPKLTVLNGGNIGIGTTTPFERLHVNGNIRSSNLAGVGTRMVATDANGTLISTAFGAVGQVLTQTAGGPAWQNNSSFWSRSVSGQLYPSTISDYVGIGTATPNALLQLGNTVTNRKIVLYDTNNNDHQYYGFGINGGTLRYQTDATAADHVFFAGVNSTTSNELMRIKGNGLVGIGTNNPAFQLDISGLGGNTIDLRTSGRIWSNSTEGGLWLNNAQNCFVGNMNLTQFGFWSNNFGWSTFNIDRMTGNIGIGTTTPAQKVDIIGKIKITDGTQGVGKVLSSDANGVGTWVNNTAITPAVIGVFPGGGANIGNGTAVGVQSPMTYCNVYIDLPVGKWIVFGTYLLAGTTSLTSGQSVFVRTTLSTSNTVLTNTDILSGGLVSGSLNGPCDFGLANGQTIINNTSGATKRYYLWANVQKFGTTPTAFTMAGVGSNFWSENQLSAIPTN